MGGGILPIMAFKGRVPFFDAVIGVMKSAIYVFKRAFHFKQTYLISLAVSYNLLNTT